MQKSVEKIIDELAIEFNLPKEVIKAVVDSQFLCTREYAKLGIKGEIDTYKNIRWRNFGTLIVKPGKLNIIHSHANKNTSNKNIQDRT